jgi:hypothetical protein
MRYQVFLCRMSALLSFSVLSNKLHACFPLICITKLSLFAKKAKFFLWKRGFLNQFFLDLNVSCFIVLAATCLSIFGLRNTTIGLLIIGFGTMENDRSPALHCTVKINILDFRNAVEQTVFFFLISDYRTIASRTDKFTKNHHRLPRSSYWGFNFTLLLLYSQRVLDDS